MPRGARVAPFSFADKRKIKLADPWDPGRVGNLAAAVSSEQKLPGTDSGIADPLVARVIAFG